jgi:glycosyltransferase involved in cell wall biosynthesis
MRGFKQQKQVFDVPDFYEIMKIAVNTRILLPGKLEGVGRFTYEVLKRLVEMRPDDEFFFFFDRPHDEAFVFGPNVRPVVLSPQARHPLLFYCWFEHSVAEKLKELRPDLFLTPDGFLSLKAKIPTVQVIHDIAYVHFPEQISWINRQYYRRFMPRFVKKAHSIVAVSEFSKRDVVREFGVAAEKISVACNGARPGLKPLTIEERARARDKYSDGKPYFLYVGAIHPRKNISRLIQAFDTFKEKTGSPIKLLLAGRKAWKVKEIENSWEQAHFREDILFLGYVDDEELPALYGGAFCLTYVSLFEGFGIPILEAMKAGIPVITSKRSSMPEVGGEAVLLADPYSIASIAESLQLLWENPRLQQKLVLLGLQQCKQFTWEKATEVVNQAIEATKWK